MELLSYAIGVLAIVIVVFAAFIMADDRVRVSRIGFVLGIIMMTMTLWGGVSCLIKSSEMNTIESSNPLPSETTVK